MFNFTHENQAATMLRIYFIVKSRKENPEEYNVRFRLRDGRKADISHKSDLKGTAEDLAKFTTDGQLQPRVSVYNRELFDGINREIQLMRDAYNEMLSKGLDLTAEVMDTLIEGKRNPIVKTRHNVKTLISQFHKYLDNARDVGAVGERRGAHIEVVCGKLERFLAIKGISHLTPPEFGEEQLLEFRNFLYDEYLYVPQHRKLYKDMKPQNIPEKRLSSNTVVSQLKMLQTFFTELEFRGEIDRSPFRTLSKEHKKAVMKTMYDAPIFLRSDEFERIRKAKIPACLERVRDAFLVQCAFGCRIADFQAMTIYNVSVSPEGIPYVHYMPQKTAGEQDFNTEIQTPIVRFAFDIIKRTEFRFPIIRNIYGKSGYNVLIKSLLKECDITRTVPVYDEEKKANIYQPICELGSSKLARKTHVDMMSKVQIDLYAAGLHKKGSSAVNRYTAMEIKDRFALINMAFGEKPYKVNAKLEIIGKK